MNWLIGELGKLAKIEQIGSIKVPGLNGKGLIDILVAVSKTRMSEARYLLSKSGFKWEEEHDWGFRHFLDKIILVSTRLLIYI